MAEKYFEFVEHDIEHRGNIVKLSDAKSFISRRRDYVSYTSMFLFDEDIITHIENLQALGQKSSVTGYVGKCFMNFLWIDIDTDDDDDSDLEKNVKRTIVEVKKVIDNMILKYNMDENNFKIYFSGKKGFHIGIPAHLFGAENYSSEMLPTICKVLAKEMCEGSRMLDTVIYNTTRIFRTPHSRHQTTGFYKVQVSYDTIANLASDKIIENSEFCVSEHSELNLLPNTALTMMFQECAKKASKQFDLLGTVIEKDNDVTKNKSLFRLPEKGMRNDSIFRMGVKLFSIPKEYLPNQQVIDLLRLISDAVNNAAVIRGQEPLSEHEVRTFINQSFKYTRLNQAMNQVEAKGVTDFAMRVFHYAKNSKFVSTTVPEFDADLGGGGVLGNLYSVIGKGGTMKSILLQNIQILDCRNGNYNLYLNMEMSENSFFDRTCRMLLNLHFIEEVKSGNITMDMVKKIEQEINDEVGGRLIVVNKNDLSPQDIADISKRKEDELGHKINSIVADSASAMHMPNNDEVAAAVQNSRALKEVAKKENKCIFLINHCNASAPHYVRDISSYIRGGTKTLDNGDGYFMLSKIVDQDKSNFNWSPPDIIAAQGLVWVRFVNKRESGNTIDKVLSISDDLVLDLESRDPKEFQH